MADYTVHVGDCIESMKKMQDGSIHTCITSPPYFGLRDYGVDGQIGLEATPDEFVAAMVDVFREVKRVLRDDGTLWLNLGDSYAKNKQLIGVPWKVAFALQEDGWILRQDIIWSKTNPAPEPMWGRCARSHEYIFLLSKGQKYYFDGDAIRGEPNEQFKQSMTSERKSKRSKKEEERYQMGQKIYGEGGTQMSKPISAMYSGYSVLKGPSKKSVWSVPRSSFKGAHFATFPPELIEPCVLAGCPEGGTVLDPFGGSGTTAGVALKHGRNAVLCELNPEYAALIPDRIESISMVEKPKKQKKFTPEEQQLLL